MDQKIYVHPRVKPDWCPGCGNFAQHNAIRSVLSKLNIEPYNVVTVSGIGCSSNMPEYLNTYGFHGIHGRLLPVAQAIKWSNPDLTVIAYGGDGDGYFEGTNHLIHAAKRNVDITYIVSDNQIFGLTTGQASPTSELGMITKTTPYGNVEYPINPLTIALSAGATFVARGFSGELAHLEMLIQRAIEHKGFSLIDVMSPCITWNKLDTYEYFKQKTYKLDEEHITDFSYAYNKALETEKIPIGIFYEISRPKYEDLDPVLKTVNLSKDKIQINKDEALKEFL
ncbi:MAG: thiamine pyrophosphate-dependent enzyme [Thermoplasmata archaeon]